MADVFYAQIGIGQSQTSTAWTNWQYTTATSYATNTIWYQWQPLNQQQTALANYNTQTTTATQTTWDNWNQDSRGNWYYWQRANANQANQSIQPAPGMQIPLIQVSEEQQRHLAENARRQAEERRKMQEEAAARAAEVQEATERAVRLFEQTLSTEQRDQYAKSQSFTVISGKSHRKYRIDHGYQRNVRLLREDGAVERNYCCHLSGDLPIHDHMLAQKLFLEHDEESFLALANVS